MCVCVCLSVCLSVCLFLSVSVCFYFRTTNDIFDGNKIKNDITKADAMSGEEVVAFDDLSWYLSLSFF